MNYDELSLTFCHFCLEFNKYFLYHDCRNITIFYIPWTLLGIQYKEEGMFN